MTKAAELAKMGEVITNSQIGGRRNIVINGAMNVAQRGTSQTGISASANESYSTVDRFRFDGGSHGGVLTASQSTDAPTGFSNSFKMDCTTADTSIAAGEYFIFQTSFEGQDVQQFAKGTSSAKPITVSFYVKGNASATYTVELRDVDNSRRNSQEFSVTTDWVRITRTFVADTTGTLDDDNANSFTLQFWLHAGSTYTGGTHTDNVWHNTNNQIVGDNNTSFFDSTDRTFFITGLQMEVGSQATPFEHRSFGEELALCQRYFQARTGHAGNWGGGVAYSTTSIQMWLSLPVEMRAGPTLSFTGTLQASDGGALYNSSESSFAGTAVSTTSAGPYLAGFSGITHDNPYIMGSSATGSLLKMDSEL